jgi:glucokinase-like ROK family protein
LATSAPPGATVTDEHLDSLVSVLDLVRSRRARTRPALQAASGFGRTVVTQRVVQLIDCGLLEEGRLGPSTGGRSPRELSLRSGAGLVLAAALGASSISVGISDLSGNLLNHHEEPNDVAVGPERTLSRVEELFDKMLWAGAGGKDVWGVGIGVPGPVEFSAGRPVSPPIMPGWHRYPVGKRLADRYRAAAWVDNDVNLMALGEIRTGVAQGEKDIVFVKVGTGIGAGLISEGHIHRGADGAAGDIGHVAVTNDPSVVCRCGNIGCLEAIAGGAALARQGEVAALEGRSSFLELRMAEKSVLDVSDITDAAERGDPVAVSLLTQSGQEVGRVLAWIVNFYNPSLILIGGGVAGVGDLLLASIREGIYRRSLPLATRNLRVVRSAIHRNIGLGGAAAVVLDELFAPSCMARWIDRGSPAGAPGIVAA